jgi:hypothetical protein
MASIHPRAIAGDEQSDQLTLPLEEGDEDTLKQLQCHSIAYRIAMGPQAGRKVLILQTIPGPGRGVRYRAAWQGRGILVTCRGAGEHA